MKPFAMVFPGQGSQSIGMLDKFGIKYPEIKNYFDEASSILKYDLWKLIEKGPLKELNKTYKTQPAILVSSVSIYKTWIKKGGTLPNIMTGHSLGEYSALVCSKSLKFSDAIKLVELRGKIMQNSIPKETGSMKAIIGLDKNKILEICNNISIKNKVEISNFNAPKQIVISGYKEAVEKVGLICKKMKALVISLPISIPAHCALMKSAAKKFKYILNKISFQVPQIPVFNSVNLVFNNSSNQIIKYLVEQMYKPVLWDKCIQYIYKKNIFTFLEVGPGKILSKLIKQNLKSVITISINNENNLLKAIKNNII